MTDERYNQLWDNLANAKLTPEEFNEGWHWCLDWDGLLVGPGMDGELECCCCKFDPPHKKLEALQKQARERDTLPGTVDL